MSETRLALGLGGVLLAPVLLIAALLMARGGGEVHAGEPVVDEVQLEVEAEVAPEPAEEMADPLEDAQLELPEDAELPATAWIGGPALAFPIR